MTPLQPETDAPHSGFAPLPPLTRAVLLTLAGLTLAGLALRLWGLARHGLWYDEGNTLYWASLAHNPMALYDVNTNTDALLFLFLTRGWQEIVTPLVPAGASLRIHDFALRLLVCLFSTATIPLVFAATRRAFADNRAGLFAAFLCMVSPFQIFYAQELRNYSVHAFLGMGAAWFLLGAIRRNRPQDWIGTGAFLTLALWNHYYAAWHVIAINAYFALTWRANWSRLPAWFLTQVAVGLLILPAIYHGYQVNQIVQNIKTAWMPPPDWETGLLTFKAFFAGYAPQPYLYWPLFLIAAALVLWGCWQARGMPRMWLLAALWLVLPIAGSVLLWSQRDFSYYEHRLFIVSGCLAHGLAGMGLARLPGRMPAAAAAAAIAVLSAPCLASQYNQHLHPAETHRMGTRYKPPVREAAEFIARHWREGDAIGHASHYTQPPMQRYMERLDIAIPQWHLRLDREALQGFLDAYPHREQWTRMGMLPVQAETMAPMAKRLWFVECWWEPFEPAGSVVLQREWLLARYALVHHAKADAIPLRLFCFDTSRPAEGRPAVPLDASEVLPSALEIEEQAPGNSIAYRLAYNAPETPAAARIYHAAAAADALAFNRIGPEDSVWRPSFQYIPQPPPGGNNAPAMAAHCVRGEPHAAQLETTIHLPTGEYAPFIHLLEMASPTNESRAAIRVEVLHQETSAALLETQVPGWNPNGQTGWRFRQAGIFQTQGGPHLIRISAEAPPELERCWFDFSQVALIPTEQMVQPGQLPLAGQAQGTAFALEGSLAGGRWEALMHTPDYRTVRRAWFSPEQGTRAWDLLRTPQLLQ